MNKKVLYIVAAIIIIALIAGIVYFFYGDKSSYLATGKKIITDLVKKENVQPTQPEVKKIGAETGEIIKQPVETPKEPAKDQAARLAVDFAERFGSYSNQANLKNISDLKIFMTDSMQSWADGYIEQQRKSASTTVIYYGITTKAVAKEVLDFDESAGRAVVLVHTRRQEANESMDNVSKVFNQDITVTLVKSGETWKMDSAVWSR